jgi:oxygen-independent coproporphyrinogen-3 oxidase
MAGIYIHIPFCKQACFYCDFHFSVNRKLQGNIVDAMCQEIEIQKEYLAGAKVDSIYFGGGTPSLLTENELGQILEKVNHHFSINPQAEITLEANPDDITKEKVTFWKAAGINRLSIGIQSFREEDLKWMNRAHNAKEASQAVTIAQENGIANLSLDLIYGIPGLSMDSWKQNIVTALQFNPTHLSCYALTVEENTPLHKLIRTKRSIAPVDEEATAHFNLLMDTLEQKGWEHYEISNFCKSGFKAVHNSNYWNGVPYLGIGPSAHSYNSVSRQWNVNNNKGYLKSMQEGVVPFEKEELSIEDKINEYILVSLRTSIGCDLSRIEKMNKVAAANMRKEILPYLEEGMVNFEKDIIYLTSAGKHIADGIASDLFVG